MPHTPVPLQAVKLNNIGLGQHLDGSATWEWELRILLELDQLSMLHRCEWTVSDLVSTGDCKVLVSVGNSLQAMQPTPAGTKTYIYCHFAVPPLLLYLKSTS